jgi:hypothetical protein
MYHRFLEKMRFQFKTGFISSPDVVFAKLTKFTSDPEQSGCKGPNIRPSPDAIAVSGYKAGDVDLMNPVDDLNGWMVQVL